MRLVTSDFGILNFALDMRSFTLLLYFPDKDNQKAAEISVQMRTRSIQCLLNKCRSISSPSFSSRSLRFVSSLSIAISSVIRSTSDVPLSVIGLRGILNLFGKNILICGKDCVQMMISWTSDLRECQTTCRFEPCF